MEIRVLLNMPPFRKNNISFPIAKKFNKPRFFSPFSGTKNLLQKAGICILQTIEKATFAFLCIRFKI